MVRETNQQIIPVVHYRNTIDSSDPLQASDRIVVIEWRRVRVTMYLPVPSVPLGGGEVEVVCGVGVHNEDRDGADTGDAEKEGEEELQPHVSVLVRYSPSTHRDQGSSQVLKSLHNSKGRS